MNDLRFALRQLRKSPDAVDGTEIAQIQSNNPGH
jgi:hypothetical protein